MCGIVGITSTKSINVEKRVFDKLKLLEYRGYDSFGIVSTTFEPKKFIGAVSKANLSDTDFAKSSKIAIGHTRWATHGQVSIENTHPHASTSDLFYVVHNGVISNFKGLKEKVNRDSERFYRFRSETDTEVISNLLEYFFVEEQIQDPCTLVDRVLEFLEGEFAICIMCREWPNVLICAKNKSPLVFSANSECAVVSSDEIALSEDFTECVDVRDNEILEITQQDSVLKLQLFSRSECRDVEFEERFRPILRATDSEGLGTFSDYMSKEMAEIPSVISKVNALDLKDVREFLKGKRVILTGCGSAFYACQIGQYIRKFEDSTSNTLTIPADEFENLYTYQEGDVLLCISQSGETFDTLEPARNFEGEIVAITNVAGSSLANLAKYSIIQNAGVERCVLSTKSIVSQCSILYALFEKHGEHTSYLKRLSAIWEMTFKDLEERIKRGSESMARDKIDHFFFVGRGVFNAIAMENALKLKEVTYCHAEGLGAGFFKHGTLSLIDDRFITFAHLPSRDLMPELYDLTMANIAEIQARKGIVYSIGQDHNCEVELPSTDSILDALLHLGFGQYTAYFMALALGRDVDQPRSLAKSVTVR